MARPASPMKRTASFGDITTAAPLPRFGGKEEESSTTPAQQKTRKLYELMSSYLSNGTSLGVVSGWPSLPADAVAAHQMSTPSSARL